MTDTQTHMYIYIQRELFTYYSYYTFIYYIYIYIYIYKIHIHTYINNSWQSFFNLAGVSDLLSGERRSFHLGTKISQQTVWIRKEEASP